MPVAAAGRPAGIAVCVSGPAMRADVIAASEGSSQPVVAGVSSVEDLIASRGDGPPPACVILAARWPDVTVAKSAALVRAEFGAVPVVVVCNRAGAGDVRRALASRIDGVVVASQLDVALASVIAAVMSGQSCVPSRHRSELGVQVLTTREKQILALVAMEQTNAQIAARLFLAESTVKSHLSAAFRKLNVSSRHEATTLIRDREHGPRLGIPTHAELRFTGAI